MLWTIVKRELADHLSSLRFSAILVFALLLMLGSTLVSSSKYSREIREYPRRVDQLVSEDGKVNLGAVACQGGVTVRRVPSLLAFLSGTGEQQLPNQAVLAVHGLRAVQRIADIGEILSGSSDLDWTFIIAALFSFGAGLLTYKSVSGERRDGTLALVLSQPVSRSTVLLGKYLAALLVLSAVFCVAGLVSLLVLQGLNAAPFTGDDWLKIGFFGLVSIAYLSVFVLIGLLCSVSARGPLLSAVAFTFVWTGLVFVIPNMGGVLAGQLDDVMTPLRVRELANAIPDQLTLSPGMSDDETASVKLRREQARERLLLEYLQSLIRQVRFGQNLTRVSPASTFSYAAERIVGEGTPRLTRFLRNAVRFREGFLRAMIEADRQDPASQHRYIPGWCGDNHFSQKMVDLGPAEEFRDPLPSSGEGLVAALWDVFILIVYNILAFAAAFWRFARQDVAPEPGI
jgi:ABC-type transport system involved in multi-copper enzyme maturation permease subunit